MHLAVRARARRQCAYGNPEEAPFGPVAGRRPRARTTSTHCPSSRRLSRLTLEYRRRASVVAREPFVKRLPGGSTGVTHAPWRRCAHTNDGSTEESGVGATGHRTSSFCTRWKAERVPRSDGATEPQDPLRAHPPTAPRGEDTGIRRERRRIAGPDGSKLLRPIGQDKRVGRRRKGRCRLPPLAPLGDRL